MIFSRRPPEQRSPGAIAISVALHLVLGVGLLRVVLGHNGIAEWLVGPEGRAQSERVVVVAVTPPRGNSAAGGAAESATIRPSVSRAPGPLVAPSAAPTAAPDAAGGRGGAGGGTGNGYGRGTGSGVARGIVPGYDPRLYPGSPEAPPREALTPKERLDSVIAERFAQYEDSLANAPQSNVTQDGRADLTFKRGGRTYGWTRKGIVLGKYTLPAPLLALLPLNNIGGNPSALMRGEFPTQMRNQIQAGAQVALNAETFNERVKRIRERRDRERREAREGQPSVQQPIQQPIQQAAPPQPDR
ncbi:MAG: hypothetical protein IT355_18400 [Gemmatimonadaceae bacterium]|nr:hypothetical protein [Gemmatimonadaceae bacterium]